MGSNYELIVINRPTDNCQPLGRWWSAMRLTGVGYSFFVIFGENVFKIHGKGKRNRKSKYRHLI